jgi:hypothetical protein
MTINTINKKTFALLDENKIAIAQLIYTSSAFDDAIIETAEKYLLNGIATGIWVTHLGNDNSVKTKSKIRVETGGIISVSLPGKKKKYFFKKSGGWKLRFYLTNKDGEDLLTIIPHVNWQKESHDYILQLNEEFESECDSFLILQALHCANCSLSMMTGGKVPALISV